MQMTTFLKRVLLIDSASCLLMGAGLAIGAGALATPFGLPAGFIEGAGLVLLPIGLFIGWLGTRSIASAAFVWLVVVGNLGWVAESLFVAFGQPAITALGTLFVAGQAAAVLALALLEYAGVRRAQAIAT